MKAVLLEETCNAEDLKVSEIPIPSVKDDWVLIKVLGFGINRSEIILRKYEANNDYIKLPVVLGIECVGKVVNPSNSNFKKGDNVVAIMGGLGRSFNGSYAEYTLTPLKNTFKISDHVFNKLTLEEIIAIPETYFTAYGSIEGLKIHKNDTILIRGATSATGLSAMQLAKSCGACIIATSRNENKLLNLKEKGADYTIKDNGNIESKIKEIFPDGVLKVLELIGASTLIDSMNCLANDGICCYTGILGGVEYIDGFDPIKYIPNNRYLTSFFSNYPTQAIIDNLFEFIINNKIQVDIAKVFKSLEQVSDAHLLMESNNTQGKIIFKLE